MSSSLTIRVGLSVGANISVGGVLGTAIWLSLRIRGVILRSSLPRVCRGLAVASVGLLRSVIGSGLVVTGSPKQLRLGSATNKTKSKDR